MGKVLFISFKKYNTILEGGGIANQRNVNAAVNILGKDNVDVYYVHDENKKRNVMDYVISAFLFPFGYFNGLTPSKVRDIVKKASGYDYVFINTSLFGIIAKKLKESGYKGKVITHFHNVESAYYESYLSKNLPLRSIIINCAFKNDGYCCKYGDEILTLNQRDSCMLQQLYGKSATAIVPITFADKFDESVVDRFVMTSKRPLCLFIGSCFNANNEGVLWFVNNVLPHVDVRFKVVGKGMSRLKEEYECMKDIDVVSDAPDLAPYFLEADFMILPIFSGSGMKVKTCESLMYGKNILGSTETFEGYSLDFNKVGGCCNTADEYISLLNRYIEHPVERYNIYSRNVYKENYSDKASLDLFLKIFSD